MTLILKLFSNEIVQIEKEINGPLSLQYINTILQSMNISNEYIETIKYIYNGRQLDEENLIIVPIYQKIIINIISHDIEAKEAIRTAFINYNSSSPKFEKTQRFEQLYTSHEYNSLKEINNKLSITKPLTQHFEKKDLDEINETAFKLFSDNDFLTLLRIYKSKPNLFSQLAQYVQSGKIKKMEFNNDDENTYDDEVQKIMDMNLGFDNEQVLDCLRTYNGHVNLTLRHLLSNM